MSENNRFSHIVSVFQCSMPPENDVQLAGYTALIETYRLQLPTLDKFAAISHKSAKYSTDRWIMLTPRYKPADSLFGHLTFALKYEG